MANWSGIKTNNNPTGTSTGLNSYISFNDTGANWGDMANWELRITAGLGVGQKRTILINTPITITITEAWDTVPDDTSQYELVLILRDQDHIVGNLILDAGIITELEDSATILFDGNYTLTFANSVKCNWNKSKSTLVTFQPNQITVQGKTAFWGYIYFQANISYAIKFSYIFIKCANYGLLAGSSVGMGDFSGVHHIRFKSLGLNIIQRGYGADVQNTKITHLLYEGGYPASKIIFNPVANTNYEEEYDRIWIENCQVGSGITFAQLLSPKIQILKNAIFKNSFSNCLTNIRGDADKRIFLIDSYFSTRSEVAYLAKGQNVDTMGKTFISRNVSTCSKEVENLYAHPMAIISRFNDYTAKEARQHYAFYITSASEATSDNDFICGRVQADPLNIDISEAMTSTENPIQYMGLTSPRTNAKATLNKLLELDNVQLTNLLNGSVDINFDCKNSHVGTTIDQDSNVGQKILYLANTTDFEEREVVEIGFGTARQEEGIIDTIQDGISITLKENLIYTHTLVQADTVKKQLRHFGLPFIKYGKISGDYDNETPIPSEDKWGVIYCDFENVFYGRTYEWKKYGHIVKLEGLTGGTTYYAKVFAYTPLGDLMESAEFNFTTEASTHYTDPLEENVREAITYKFADIEKIGTLDLPVVVDVRDGIKFDNDSKEGISDQALEIDVRKDIKYDNETKTGTLEVSGVTEESIYNYFIDGTRAEAFKNTDLIKRILGLSQENYRIFSPNYDANKNLLTAIIKTYSTKADCEADTNEIAIYNMVATYDAQSKMLTYKVTKE